MVDASVTLAVFNRCYVDRFRGMTAQQAQGLHLNLTYIYSIPPGAGPLPLVLPYVTFCTNHPHSHPLAASAAAAEATEVAAQLNLPAAKTAPCLLHVRVHCKRTSPPLPFSPPAPPDAHLHDDVRRLGLLGASFLFLVVGAQMGPFLEGAAAFFYGWLMTFYFIDILMEALAIHNCQVLEWVPVRFFAAAADTSAADAADTAAAADAADTAAAAAADTSAADAVPTYPFLAPQAESG